MLRALEWRRLEGWLRRVASGPSSPVLQRKLEELSSRRLVVMEQLVAQGACLGLVNSFSDVKRSALNRYLTALRKYGKTGGKYAARWMREIRAALDESKDAVPVWVMPVNRVLGSFGPGATPPFDVLIVDEASQISLFGLPILALASKAIVVGDDQQTSPENVGLARGPVHDLIDTHLRGIRNAVTLFDGDNSLYDVARQQFPEVVVLREHFRCLPAIISFSNRQYYDDSMIVLRDRPPAAGWVPVRAVHVPEGFRDGKDINEPEAQRVVDTLARLCADPAYDEMTIGFVTLLGRAQSQRIQDLLFDRLGPAELEARDIRCGEPPVFQGDERDVVIISTVVDAAHRIGAMTDRNSQRRLNVAASRAKNQLWVVHSVVPEDFPSGDPRAELIRHCQNPFAAEVLQTNLDQRCESQFERDVLRQILNRGYRRVRVQHEVGRFRIDIVVEGPEARLAVECDGDAWHGPERWDDDRRRQQKLERAGWTFERIRGSAFYRHGEEALEPLWSRPEELRIPTGEWDAEPPPVARSPSAPVTPDLASSDSDTTRRAPQGAQAAAPPPPPPTKSGAATQPGGPQEVEPAAESAASPEQTNLFPGGLEPVLPIRPVAVPREQASAQAWSAMLAGYRRWAVRPTSAVHESSSSAVLEELVEIVAAEGPMHALRAYRLHARAAGGQRVGREMRHAYNSVVTQGMRKGRLAQLTDGIAGVAGTTLYLPNTVPVQVRELGGRDLTEVPRSEVATLIQQLGLRGRPAAQAKRSVLNA
ncbi:MAG: AAA domain-containing protein [Candidatus Latescibacterota bacterium]